MTANTLISPLVKQQFNQNGVPLAGGKLFTYITGTATKQATYTNSLGVTPNTNPIILDANGQCDVWLVVGETYRFVLSPSTDTDPPTNPFWTEDNISAGALNGVSISNATITSATITNSTISNTNIADLFNQRVALSSNTTVSNSDDGALIALGGSAFFTLTFSAASGYNSGFCCMVVNEDIYSSQGSGTQGRAKNITFTGQYGFFLWPGQNVIVKNDNGNWRCVPGGQSSGNNERWKIPGPITIFVDPTNGSDSNDGMATGSGNALQHVAQAVVVLYQQIDCNNYQCFIQIVAGSTVNEAVQIANPPVGSNVFYIESSNLGSQVVWNPTGNNTSCLLIGDGAEVEVAGIYFYNGITAYTGCTAIAMHQTAICDILGSVTFGFFGGGNHIEMDHGGGSVNASLGYTIAGNAAVHANIGPTCYFGLGGTVTSSGAPIITTLFQATGCAVISMANPTFTGSITTTQWSVSGNAALFTGGASVPGSSGGTTSGGQIIT